MSAGTYHDFHSAWMQHLKEAFNAGILPEPYYAQGEQRARDIGPEFLALSVDDYGNSGGPDAPAYETKGGVVAAIRDGVHVLVIDPLPTRADLPGGIHGCVWDRLMADTDESPPDRPLTFVSYCVTHPITAYVEPTRVGSLLTEMPLFLTPEHYVPAPLEETYMQAYRGIPRRWRRVIEGGN